MPKLKYEVIFTLTDNPGDGAKPTKKKALLDAAKAIVLPEGVTAGKFSISRIE
jgi:hypothetical protein